MRRRQPETESTVPAELATYVADVWTGRGGVDGWLAARLEWVRADGGATVDPIDFIRENAAVKRRLAVADGRWN